MHVIDVHPIEHGSQYSIEVFWSFYNSLLVIIFLALILGPKACLLFSHGCRQILLASEIMVLLGIVLSFQVIIPYSVPQYVISGLIMFVSAEVLEGKISIFSSLIVQNQHPIYFLSFNLLKIVLDGD